MKLWLLACAGIFFVVVPLSHFGSLYGQQLVRVDPDCPVNGAGFAFTAGGQAGPGPSGFIDNRATGCSNWTLTYEQVGTGALQIELQSAPDNAGVPGTWVTFAGGTVQQGANPSTATPYGIIQIQGYAPFVRVRSDSQSANVIGFVFGARSAAGAGSGGAAAGCPGTAASPCDVQGLSAPGGTQTGQPLPISLVDSNNKANYLKTAQATSDGDTGFEFSGAAPMLFNGINYDREIDCTASAPIIVDDSTMGNVQIIAASGATKIRICKLSLTAAAGVSIQLTQGTGSNCGTGTANLSGLYQNVLAIAEDYRADQSQLTAAASQAVCLNLSGATRTTGTVSYAQY
jgi:hypothetical protein